MKEIYFDNAATTEIDPKVLEVFVHELRGTYGNPSSIHSKGRSAKAKTEASRKKIAKLFHVEPRQVVFTSGGTEANNIALRSAVVSNGVQQIISTELEHPAVKNTLIKLQEEFDLELLMLSVDSKGGIDFLELEEFLKKGGKSLVSIMHGNNEIGNLLDLDKVGALTQQYDALFHSDTVQTVGHQHLDLSKLPVDFITCSAHKIHGPKGVGFLIVNKDKVEISPLIQGGGQERGLRSGTENVAGICAMAAALELAYADLVQNEKHLAELKGVLISSLTESGIAFELNGAEDALNNVVSVRLLESGKADLLLFQLDLAGLFVSGGSACSSGSLKGSAVLDAIGVPDDQTSLRFSFSRNNTLEEVKEAVRILKAKLS